MEFIETQLKGNLLVDLSNDSETNEIPKAQDKKSNKNENKLTEAFALRGPSCGIIVVDNFYNNAQGTRDYILTQEFSVKGNFPGQRTISYANEHLRHVIQSYVAPFGGIITDFPMPSLEKDIKDTLDTKSVYNGSFQYTTSRERSWVHADGWNNWAGVLYLTPDAPIIFRHRILSVSVRRIFRRRGKIAEYYRPDRKL